MAKTIIIDTEVKGVEQAIDDINKIDNAVDGVNDKSISPKFDTAKTEKSLENLQKTGERIEKVGQGIAGGFALATGVVGAFGSELGFSSEEIEKAQAKASSFIGVLVSIKPVIEGVKAGFQLLKNANPFGIIATIVGLLITAFGGMDKIIGVLISGFKTLSNAIGGVVDFVRDLVGGYASLEKSQKAGAAIAEASAKKRREQLHEELSNLNKIENSQKKRFDAEIHGIDFAIRKAQASGQNHTELEKKKLEKTIERIKQEIIFEQKKATVLAEIEGDIADQLGVFGGEVEKGNEERAAKRKAKQEELAKDLMQTEEALVIFGIEQNKKGYDEWKANEEKKTAKLKEETDKRLAWEKQVNDDLKVVESKKSDDYLVGQTTTADATKNVWASMYGEIARTGNETATKDLEAQKELNQMRIDSVATTLSILTDLNELFAGKSKAQQERAFKVQKAINIANAIIDTYKGANTALASAPAPFNFINMAAVISAGLLNIKKIASTQFGGGVPSDGGGGGGVGSAPSLPTVDTSSVAFQFPSVGGNNPQSNQQTFVSVTEINSVNNRVQVAEANATFG